MMLFRYLASVALVSALAAGCNQSLFDDGPGGGDGRRDGAPEPMAPDGSVDDPDSGMVMRLDGGGGGAPDARPSRPACPSPCLADAYVDFASTQGGLNGLWRYVEVRLEAAEEYANMSENSGSWQGTSSPAPGIAPCPVLVDEPPCAGLVEIIALTTTSNEPGVHHPGLMWVAPKDGVYRWTGTWQVSFMAPAAEVTMTLTQNSQSNVLISETLTRTAEPHTFDTAKPIVAGDVIVLSAIATTGTSVPVGVNFFVSGPY
jgi:hypothetical protein